MPILRAYSSQGHREAAHIVSDHLSEKRLQGIFDLESAGELYSECNGLLFDGEVEWRFNPREIAFIPEMPMRSAQLIEDWRIQVMDSNILDRWVAGKDGAKWKHIDGQPLRFLSSARPAARYLHFQLVIALLRAKRHNRTRKPDGWTCY